MAPPFLGEIKLLASATLPPGWALCNGQLLPINQNQALFALLGNKFGGDAHTTFALPDLRGRVPVHTGAGIAYGTAGGQSDHTLSLGELAQHTHPVIADATLAPAADGNQPKPARRLAGSFGASLYGPPSDLVAMNAGAISSIGGGNSHENTQPFLTVNFMIALQGHFPAVRRKLIPRGWLDVLKKLFGRRA
jgi:microcystin-dependent protein